MMASESPMPNRVSRGWTWAAGALVVVVLLYLASLESRLSRRVSTDDLNALYESTKNMSLLRTEISDLSAKVQEITRSGRGKGGLPHGGAATVPIGAVAAFAARADNLPEGWLLCDGSSLPREGEYANLFAVIGTAYGSGDGSSTFEIPDYRGLFLRGVDDADGPGGNEPAGRDPEASERIQMGTGNQMGDAVGTLQGDSTRSPNTPFITLEGGAHAHSVEWSREGGGGMDDVRHAFQSSTNRYGETTVPRQNDARRPERDGAHIHVIDRQSGDRETRPINASVNWIIKAKNAGP